MKLKHLLSFAFVALPLMASAQIQINETNFPDENFRNYLREQDYGQDGVITDEEIKGITYIGVTRKKISSLKGIEFFIALTELNCYDNQLTALDVSKNTALTTLSCYENLLTALDVSKNTALTDLSCYGNQLTTLDVSKNTALEYLQCYINQLTALDVTKNTALRWLRCLSNQLTTLDVSKNTKLTWLECGSNQLTALDVSKNTALTEFDCSFNQLTALDMSRNTELTYLKCEYNQIKGISMDALINSLPENPNKGITFDDNGTGSGDLNDDYADGETSSNIYRLYIFIDIVDEGNICTRKQVAAIKAKGWTPYDNVAYPAKEYAGCDDPTSVTVSVNADGLSTYCPVFDVDFSSATKIAAYTATVSDNTVYLEKVKAVAAGEGVLLRSLNGGEVTEELPINKAEKHEGNAFVGTLETIVLKEKVDNVTNFILGRNSGILGFYKANDTRLAAWEAYLPVTNYNPSKPLRIIFSDVTDINEIIAQPSTEDDAFYTLSGVRVANPTKGIYIKNGKKVVVK